MRWSINEKGSYDHYAYSNILHIADSSDIELTESTISQNSCLSWSIIEEYDSSNVILDKCLIENNSEPEYVFLNDNSHITVKGTTITGNSCKGLVKEANNALFQNCIINSNSFDIND